MEECMKKLLASLIATLMFSFVCAPVARAQKVSDKEEKHLHKMQKTITRLKRWDSGDPIAVKLQDGTRLKGYIGEVADDHFVITDRGGRQPRNVEFAQVKDVGVGFGSKTRIALAISGGVLAIFAVCVISKRCQE